MNSELKYILSQIQGEKYLRNILKKNTIVDALVQKNYSLLDIYQLEENDYQNEKKKIRDTIEALKEKIEADPEYFIDYYKYVICSPIEVGSECTLEKGLAGTLVNSLKEIETILKIKANLSSHFFEKNEFNSFYPLSQYISDYFGLDGQELLSFEAIGKKYGKSGESIRTNLLDYKTRSDLRTLFLEEKAGLGLKINSSLINSLKEVFDTNLYRSSFLDEFRASDFLSLVAIERLLSLFNLELIEIVSGLELDKYYVLCEKKDTLLYRSHLILLDKVFREGKAYTKTDLKLQLSKEISLLVAKNHHNAIKEHGIHDDMLEALLDDYIKLETKDYVSDNNEANDEDLYQFKWEFLSSVTARVERILLTEDGSMHNNQILEKYNELARAADLKVLTTDQLTFRRTDNIKPIGKSGFWISTNGESETNFVTLQNFIDDAILKKYKGKVEFETLKSYLKTTEYADYPDNSIRAYILNCSRKAIDNNNLFIHENCIDHYPEIKVVDKRNSYFGNDFIKMVIKIIESDEGKRKEKGVLRTETITALNDDGVTIKNARKFDAYLKRFTDAGILICFNINGNYYFSIDYEELDKHDIEQLGKQVEPEYKRSIKAHAINYLKRENKVPLSVLREETKHLMPKRVSFTNLYKIFDNKNIFLKEEINNQKWISLDHSLLPKPQELHVEVNEEFTELLGNTPAPLRLAYDRDQLKEQVIKELFSEVRHYRMDKTELADNFDHFYNSILDGSGKPSRWGDSLLQSLFELLNTKTDYYDRETCLNKLILGYETYLKSFIPNWDKKTFEGQVDVINYFPSSKEIWVYKFEANRDDIQKKNFSYILHSLKYLSDRLRHDGNHDSLDMGLNKQIKNAIDFIALYLFTAQIIKSDQETIFV